VSNDGRGYAVAHFGCGRGCGGADESATCCSVASSAASDSGTTVVNSASSSTSDAEADGAKHHVGTAGPYSARDPGGKAVVGARAAAKISSCSTIGGRCEGGTMVDFN